MSSLAKLRTSKKTDSKKDEKRDQKSQNQNQARVAPALDCRPEFLRSVPKLMNDRPHISKSHNPWLESLMSAMLGQKEFEMDASVFISTKWAKIPEPKFGQNPQIDLADVESDDDEEPEAGGNVAGAGGNVAGGEGPDEGAEAADPQALAAAAAAAAAAKNASDQRIYERRKLEYDAEVKARVASRHRMFQHTLLTLDDKVISHLKSKIGPEQWLHFSLIERSLPKLLRLIEQEFHNTGHDKTLKSRRMNEFTSVRQKRSETLSDYYSRFCTAIKEARDVEASIGDEPELVYFLMHRVNSELPYKRAVEALDIEVNRGEKAYPATLDSAYAWLEQVPIKAQFTPIRLDVGEQLAYLSERVDKITAKKKPEKKKSRATEDESDEDDVTAQDWWKDAECFGCGETGHIKAHCPKGKSSNKGTADKKSGKKKGGDKKKNVTTAFTLLEDDDDDDGERLNCIATRRVMSATPGPICGRQRKKIPRPGVRRWI